MWRRSPRPRSLTAKLLGAALIAASASCSNPRWWFEKHRVSGAMMRDGRCIVVLDGDTILPSSVSRSISFDNAISCGVPAESTRFHRRLLGLRAQLPPGASLKTGSYPIVPTLEHADQASFDAVLDAAGTPKMPTSSLRSYISADTGIITIELSGDSIVMAQFQFVGKRHADNSF